MNAKTFLLLLVLHFGARAQEKSGILIYTKTSGYAHGSIPDGVKAVQKIALENNLIADTTSQTSSFTEENLRRYSAIVFISTNGRLLDTTQKTEFVRYIQAGGGFVGIHGASTGGKGWPWYIELVGASFIGHPEPKEGLILNENPLHETTKRFPEKMTWKDEWYNFTEVQPGLNILLSVDEASYIGGENGKRHPISWYREFDGGRSFYTALGHFSYHFTDAIFLKHIEAGIKYAIGKQARPDYSKVSTPRYSGH